MVTAKNAVNPSMDLSKAEKNYSGEQRQACRANVLSKKSTFLARKLSSISVSAFCCALSAVAIVPISMASISMASLVGPFVTSASAEEAAADSNAVFSPIETKQIDFSTLRRAILDKEAETASPSTETMVESTEVPASASDNKQRKSENVFAPVDGNETSMTGALQTSLEANDNSQANGQSPIATGAINDSGSQQQTSDDLARSEVIGNGTPTHNSTATVAQEQVNQPASASTRYQEPVYIEETYPTPPASQTTVAPAFQAPVAPVAAPYQSFGFVTTLGAVALALAATMIALRVRRGAKKSIASWRGRFAVLEAKLDETEAVLSAQSRLVVIWDEGAATPAQGWGRPKVLGNSTTLATLLRYSISLEGTTPIEAILEGLSKQMVSPTVEDAAGQTVEMVDGNSFDGQDNALPPLLEAVQDLRWNGTAFALTVTTFDGRIIEVSGYPAGGQAVVWISDITAQGHATNSLRDKLLTSHREGEHLKQLLNNAPFPVWRRQADSQLVWVNQAYADAVEQPSPEEVVAKEIELDNASKKLSDRARQSGESCLEKHYVVIGGKRRALDFIEMPHEDGSFGMALDVTGVDQAERQLKLHMDSHAETLDKLATAVAIYDSDKNLQFYNQAYATCWNMDPAWLDTCPSFSEILDRLRTSRLLPEQADFKSWKDQQQSLFTEIKEQPDQLWHLPDGRHLRVVCQAHPMGGLLFFYEDVTDRFKLESSLNTLSKVQSATLDNLSEGVAVFGSDGCLELHNRSFEEIWRLTSEDIKKKPHVKDFIEACRSLFDDEAEWTRVGERMASVREDRHTVAGRLERSDARFIDYAILPLPNGATLFTSLDVTDTTRITKALQERAEALEAADKLKSEFISHVSYQLRTPLTTIKGFSEMLDQEIFGSLNERQREYSDAILEASNHLMVLMDDILDLARIEAGVMSIEPSKVNVRDVLESAIDLTRRETDEKNIKLKLEAASDIGTIWADERRLRQIVFNLLANANTFSDENGEITIGADRSKAQLRIWVQDTGQGIDPEHQAIVFDRFESRASVGRRRGAGLGLALVRSFVELHGGWVSLESEPNKGTKVVCYFPLTKEGAQPPLADRGTQDPQLPPTDKSFFAQPAAE